MYFCSLTFAATVKASYLCGVNAAWLEMVPVLAHNQVDAGSNPAAATPCCLDFNWYLTAGFSPSLAVFFISP